MLHRVSSYQNDGNFSQIDLNASSTNDRALRLESFRGSHPMQGKNYRTAAGTTAYALTGADHLRTSSSQVFRHVVSIAEEKKGTAHIVILEIRELFQEDGSWQVKLRDLDCNSASYGQMIVCTVTPQPGKRSGSYRLTYEIYDPQVVTGYMMTSPLADSIHNLDRRLLDISETGGKQGVCQLSATHHVDLHAAQSEIDSFLQPFINRLRETPYSRFIENVRRFLKFGSLQGKCQHDGENLTGQYRDRVAEQLGYFASSVSMILLGSLFCDLSRTAVAPSFSLWEQPEPMSLVTPSIASPYLLAHVADIELYQLILDKVHSDYRGLRMKQPAGSMLENGAKAIKSAYRANQTLAEIAVLFYEPHFARRLK